MIQLTPEQHAFILFTLHHHMPQARFLAFGSRVSGTAKPYSDLDIAVMDEKPIHLLTLSALTEALSESDLPFKVDIVDWHRISEEFQQVILRASQEL